VLAYLDANSGSILVSALAGGIAGLVLVAKMGWRHFLALFSPSKRAELRAEREAAADAAPETADAASTTAD
jgi:hypothetical protein